MPLVLGLAILVFLFSGQSVGTVLTPRLHPLQEICASVWSLEPLTTLGTAMVCGLELPPGETKDLFLRTGLYHVLVVSGAHLVWLAELARPLFPRRPLWTAAILALFAGMTGLGAPLVRAGLQMLFHGLRPRPWLANAFWSYAGALALHPDWWNSVSLHLSALAALGMGLPFAPRNRGLAILALTLPVVLPFGSFTLPGALTGVLLSPLVEFVFFPVSLLAWVIPWLQPLANVVARAGLAGLRQLAIHYPTPVQIAALLPAASLPIYFLAVWGTLVGFSARGRLAR